MLFQKFHSPALGGFAIVAHWLPSLFFSVYSGALADRFDPRRIIQVGMLCFMAASLCWGILILTDTLQIWHALVLLILHGVASVLWQPSSQMLLHNIVAPQELQSAVRLNASARQLGLLMGPAVGAGLLLLAGPAYGILLNVLVYVPTLWWMWKAPHGSHSRDEESSLRGEESRLRNEGSRLRNEESRLRNEGSRLRSEGSRPRSEGSRLRDEPGPPRVASRGFAEIAATVRDVAGNRTIVSMTLLAGGASLFIGNAYQAQMPEFALDLGHDQADISYSMLLAADAAGALLAGVVLESRGLLQARPRTAFVLAMLWCLAIAGFAAATAYPFALALLFASGFLALAFNSMTQTLVQLRAPAHIRGRVIGLYNMASLGLRAFSGITVGIVGGVIGIHWSLALSAIALFTLVMCLLAFSLRGTRAG